MTICHSVLTPIIVLVRTLVQTVREVVRTVCEWVSSSIRTIRTVVERVCSWLPWPLSEICNLVTRVIEVIETVWNWVCREVIDRIIEWVERIVEYVAYIVRWVCWAVSWGLRGPALLLCLLGVKPRRFLHVCLRVITDAEGQPAASWEKIEADLKQAQTILDNCSLEIVVTDRQRVERPEFLDGTTCEFSGLFSDFFTWFSANECDGCAAVTVYYVRSIPGAIGCAYPGANWVTIAAEDGRTGGDGRTIVQEVGHLADLWSHSSDPSNVMTDQNGGTKDQITTFQCCMLRTSRFSSALPCPRLPRPDMRARPPAEPAPVPPEREMPSERPPATRAVVSHAFQRIRGPELSSRKLSGTGAAQAAVALAVVVWLMRGLRRVVRR
jgi:hypothetical protein